MFKWSKCIFHAEMFSGNNYLDSITQTLIGSYEPVIDADGWRSCS